jgi:phage FluMu gp28-like protein
LEKSRRPISPESAKTLESLRTSLPTREFAAIAAWLTTFYAYQLEWLLDWARFALLNKARQIGASHSYAAAAVLWAMLGETTTIISVGEREAFEVVEKAKLHASVLHKLGSRWAKAYLKGTELKFASGGRIIALPASSGGRSYSGNVILDEAAYLDAAERVWDGAAAVVMHGGRLRVMSTPNGIGNLWHGLWSDPKQNRGYRKHQVTIDEARADGLKVNDDECWKMARGDPRVFDQLFRCVFLDNDQQYIPTALISACVYDDTYCYEGEAFGGLDIGRTTDLTALVVVRRDADGMFHEQQVYECKRTSIEQLNGIVASAFADFRLSKLCVDSTGLGAFPAEQMQKAYGKHFVEAVPFTLQSKNELATTLYEATRSSDRGHADRAWALALALYAGSGPDRRKHDLRTGF